MGGFFPDLAEGLTDQSGTGWLALTLYESLLIWPAMTSAKSLILIFTFSLSFAIGQQAHANWNIASLCQSLLHGSNDLIHFRSSEDPSKDKVADPVDVLERTFDEFQVLTDALVEELTRYQLDNQQLGFQLKLVPANLRLKPNLALADVDEAHPIVDSENPWEIVKIIRGRRGNVDFDPSLWPIQIQAMDLEGGHYDEGMALGIYGTEKRLFTLLRTDRIVLSEERDYRNWAHEAALLGLLESWANEFKPEGQIQYVPRAFHSTASDGPGFTAIRELAISVKGFKSREELIQAHLFLLEKIALLVKESQKAGELAYRDAYVPALRIKPSF